MKPTQDRLVNRWKDKIRSARLQTALAINKEVIELYWHMGKQIIEKQNWGSKLIETLSLDLQNAFPETSGFSVRNLRRMRQFAAHFPDLSIMPQAVAQLPWGHISLLIHKVKDNNELTWYAEKNADGLSNIEFTQLDATKLEFNKAYDMIYARFTIFH